MASSRPDVLRIGTKVRFHGSVVTIVSLAGNVCLLGYDDGEVAPLQRAHLLASSGFEVIDRSSYPAQRPADAAGHVPQGAADDAGRWEPHIIEILTGRPPGAAAESPCRPEYDPALRTLAEREAAKAAELCAQGEDVTPRTVRRKRQQYQVRGQAGLRGRPG